MLSTTPAKAGLTPTNGNGSHPTHLLGAAGEYVAAAYFLSEGQVPYFPAQAAAGWVDFITLGQHGTTRVQVKTYSSSDDAFRVFDLGGHDGLTPEDRYDLLAIVNINRLWVIPSAVLGHRDSLTLKPEAETCPWRAYRKR